MLHGLMAGSLGVRACTFRDLGVEQAGRNVIGDGHQHVLDFGPLLGRGRLARLFDRLTQPLLGHLAEELRLSAAPPCQGDGSARQRSREDPSGPPQRPPSSVERHAPRSKPGATARTDTVAGGGATQGAKQGAAHLRRGCGMSTS